MQKVIADLLLKLREDEQKQQNSHKEATKHYSKNESSIGKIIKKKLKNSFLRLNNTSDIEIGYESSW